LKAGLYALELPLPAAEERGAEHGEQRKRHRNRPESTLRSDLPYAREQVGERDLEQPEAQQVEERRRERVAGAVERLRQDDAVRVEQKSAAHDAQAADAVAGNISVAREGADELRREDKKQEAHESEEHHVVERRAPDRGLGAVGLLRAEILTHERGRRVA